ncbi:MAG: MFS transporter [Ktedonobacterales bacterium]|nr:MFS transporter [Ktedonobacterales bacterium]
MAKVTAGANPPALQSEARAQLTSPLALVALVFFAVNIRTVLLAVPPILPLIQHDLRLSYAATGFLNALPPLVLGILAYPASFVIGRLGAQRAVLISAAGLALLSAARAAAPNAALLILATALMSASMTLGQTALPTIVHERFARFVGQVTAAYSGGMMLGEVIAAALTVPLVLNVLVGGNWRATFLIWSLPVVASLILWVLAMPRGVAARPSAMSAPTAAPASPALNPLRSWRVWQSSILLGCGSLLFFGMDTWIPEYYHHLGRSDGSLALTVLTVGQIPAVVVLSIFGQHLAGKRLGFTLGGGVAAVALVLWFILPPSWGVALSAVIGAASAALFIFGLSLPPLLAHGRGVAQVSGIMMGLGYTIAFFGSFIGGTLWDATGIPITAFIPVLLACVVVTILSLFMPDAPSRRH